ncbi:hypothetical protein B0H12DRAFT_1133435 [Mycena haematopus]|nr:hypothetical protein B0H12DRAFT_1133435 [Mycena haematopus]
MTGSSERGRLISRLVRTERGRLVSRLVRTFSLRLALPSLTSSRQPRPPLSDVLKIKPSTYGKSAATGRIDAASVG